MHPILLLIATNPQLLADHAQAYAELLGAELGHFSSAWKRRLMWQAAALCCLSAAAVLVGVALMFCAALPLPEMPAPWALLAVPLAPLALAALCLLLARQQGGLGGSWQHVLQQFKADIAMLREAALP